MSFDTLAGIYVYAMDHHTDVRFRLTDAAILHPARFRLA